MFLRLTLSETGFETLINFDLVTEIRVQDDDTTAIYFGDDEPTYVSEIFEDIAGWLMDSTEPVESTDDYRAGLGMPRSED